MAAPTPLTRSHSFGETQAWKSLRRAIATSSGFQSWRQQAADSNTTSSIAQDKMAHLSDQEADQLVTQYLRETLETLAY